MDKLVSNKDLDKEWIELILQALEIGLSIEEIRNFINQSSRPS